MHISAGRLLGFQRLGKLTLIPAFTIPPLAGLMPILSRISLESVAPTSPVPVAWSIGASARVHQASAFDPSFSLFRMAGTSSFGAEENGAKVRVWLNRPNRDFPKIDGNRHSPLDLILCAHTELVAQKVYELRTGIPLDDFLAIPSRTARAPRNPCFHASVESPTIAGWGGFLNAIKFASGALPQWVLVGKGVCPIAQGSFGSATFRGEVSASPSITISTGGFEPAGVRSAGTRNFTSANA